LTVVNVRVEVEASLGRVGLLVAVSVIDLIILSKI
jgi:hypothetical protein